VRHADDHVHVVATLARQDGRRVFPHNDYYRAGEASRAVEAKYGMSPTAASDRTAAKRPTYAETQKTARAGRTEPVRDTLRRQVRTAAAGATTIPEFLDRLRRDGVLVHERHSQRNPGEITGYAVASSDSLDAAGKPVYYGGGRLAADLTLPKLRARWDVAPAAEPADTSTESPAAGAATGQRSARSAATAEDRSALTPAERVRIWEQATAAAARATAADPGRRRDRPPRCRGRGLGGLGLPGRGRPGGRGPPGRTTDRRRDRLRPGRPGAVGAGPAAVPGRPGATRRHPWR
jgi:hypothetical protein